LGVTGCAALLATALALAGIGSAASPSVCITNTSCISEAVAPHFIGAASEPANPATWNDAISITKFHNESGVGGATATHVVLSVTFTSAVAVSTPFVQIVSTSTQDGSGTTIPSTCTTTTTTTTLRRSCDVGNIVGGGDAKLVVRFATATSMNQPATLIRGSVTYGESGNDNPTGPNGQVNDDHADFDSLTVGGNLQGSCFDLNTTPTVSGATATQATSATVGQAALAGLPCTPALAGVEPGTTSNRPSTFTRDISFTEFLPIVGGAKGTVIVDFLTAVPKGFVLKELVNLAAPTNPASWVEVKACGDLTNPSPDSCISGTKNLARGGLRYFLSVAGTLVDPRYSG
jgi:hypothetical protein